jgi:ribonuclease P protein component
MVFARGWRPRAAARSSRRAGRAGASASVPDRDARPVTVERLKRRSDFRAAADGARASGPAFVLQARPRGDDGAVRVGFTVSRQVGNAVERNRVRRRLREVVRMSIAADAGCLRRGHDYVLIGRRAALAASFAGMLQELAAAVSRVDGDPAKRGGRGGTGGAPRDALHEAGSRSRPAKSRRGRTKRSKSGLGIVPRMLEER